jgi:hypothetical protein
MHIILFFYLFNYLLSSPCPSLDPTSVAIEIYNREKNNVISFFQSKFSFKKGFQYKIGLFPKLDAALQNLLKLDPEKLLNAMIQEDSDYFLTIFWFIYDRSHNLYKIFYWTNAFYSLGFPISGMSNDNMTKILDNFRKFVSQAFLNINALGWDESRSKKLLSLAQKFWYNRLEQLGSKVMFTYELMEQSRQIERLFSTLYNFPIDGPKELIVQENREFLLALKASKNQYFAMQRFSLVVQYLWGRLRMIPPSESLKDLEWLASQSPCFLAYFIYFLYCQETEIYRYYLWSSEGLLKTVGKDAQIFSFWEKYSLIFAERDYDCEEKKDEAIRICRVISTQIWGKKPFSI